jgi:prevent-host-death family protein
MKTITMLELRLDAEAIIAQVQKGQRMILTRRGKPVARLEPVDEGPDADDSFYSITDLAVPGGSLTNEEIDKILYGQ